MSLEMERKANNRTMRLQSEGMLFSKILVYKPQKEVAYNVLYLSHVCPQRHKQNIYYEL
jgi:hypothetical protein